MKRGRFIVMGEYSHQQRLGLIVLGEAAGFTEGYPGFVQDTDYPLMFMNDSINIYEGEKVFRESYRELSYEEAVEELTSQIKESKK